MTCDICKDKSYVVSMRSGGKHKTGLVVERCDACTLGYDEDAAVKARADGIDCDLTYPCYVHEPYYVPRT